MWTLPQSRGHIKSTVAGRCYPNRTLNTTGREADDRLLMGRVVLASYRPALRLVNVNLLRISDGGQFGPLSRDRENLGHSLLRIALLFCFDWG
jgi:hypothetical protein